MRLPSPGRAVCSNWRFFARATNRGQQYGEISSSDFDQKLASRDIRVVFQAAKRKVNLLHIELYSFLCKG